MWNGECLVNNDREDDKYDYDNEYEDAEDGKGSCGGVDDGGESDNDGRDVVRGLSFGGMGHRTSIVSPHATTAVIDDNDDNNHRRGGGALCPPPPVHPVPPDAARHCQCCQQRPTAAAWGRSECGHMHGGGGGG